MSPSTFETYFGIQSWMDFTIMVDVYSPFSVCNLEFSSHCITV